jgi:hypothetical protein
MEDSTEVKILTSGIIFLAVVSMIIYLAVTKGRFIWNAIGGAL